jgi:DNA-binding Xre family transcriptional regulator
LLDNKLKKTDLRKLADLSTTTLTKLSKDQSVGMEVMARICTALNCDIEDIVEMVSNEDAEKAEGVNGG